MSDDLHFLTIAEAGTRIAKKDLSPVELVENYVDRIESLPKVDKGRKERLADFRVELCHKPQEHDEVALGLLALQRRGQGGGGGVAAAHLG